jgi:hydrogenase maturation protease
MRLDARSHPLPVRLAGASSHGLGLAHAVELARTLGRLPHRLVVYAVPARNFTRQAGISRDTAEAVQQVVALIRGEYLSAP